MRYTPEAGTATLRELNGLDEAALRDVDTASAIELLDRVSSFSSSGKPTPLRAADLTAADRDRLLAELYRTLYGPRVATTTRCLRCGALFDVSFDLDGFVAACDDSTRESIGGEGRYPLPDGRALRLPTGHDELAVADRDPDRAAALLLEACVSGGSAAGPALDRDVVQGLMASLAPLLEMETEVSCAECGALQRVHFDVQSYLLTALLQDKTQLTLETHRIAWAYGWSREEILSLSRSERQTLVDLIESERTARRRGAP